MDPGVDDLVGQRAASQVQMAVVERCSPLGWLADGGWGEEMREIRSHVEVASACPFGKAVL